MAAPGGRRGSQRAGTCLHLSQSSHCCIYVAMPASGLNTIRGVIPMAHSGFNSVTADAPNKGDRTVCCFSSRSEVPGRSSLGRRCCGDRAAKSVCICLTWYMKRFAARRIAGTAKNHREEMLMEQVISQPLICRDPPNEGSNVG